MDGDKRRRRVRLDEWGHVPTGKTGIALLFDVLSTAYERQILIVTTNLPFEQWTGVLGSEIGVSRRGERVLIDPAVELHLRREQFRRHVLERAHRHRRGRERLLLGHAP